MAAQQDAGKVGAKTDGRPNYVFHSVIDEVKVQRAATCNAVFHPMP